jgi:hypothetical protein
MKKTLVVFILLLLAVPAMANITVTATCSGVLSPYTVTVSYSVGAGDTLAPRAFRLNITCDASGTIGTVVPITTDYYVAPGTLTYSGADITNWGSQITNKTNTSFLYEACALYSVKDAVHKTPPSTSGVLMTFPLTVPTGTTTVSITGSVVREDPAVQGNITLTGFTTPAPTCLPATPEYVNQIADLREYQSYNPTWDGACWCGSNQWKYQCDGDADGATETLLKLRVYNNDYAALTANWKKKVSDTNPCADFDHKSEGMAKYRVYNNDYNRLVSNWKKKDSALPGNCPRPDGQN